MANQLANTDPILPGLLPPADEVAAILGSISVDMEGRTPVVSRLPTPDEIKALQRRNIQLARAIEPALMKTADLQTARAELSRLFLGFPQLLREGGDLVNAYLLVLQKFPLFAIIDSCNDVANGRIKNQDDRFPPTSPQMAKAAAQSLEHVASERIKIERLLTARKLLRPVDDPAGRKRIGGLLRGLADSLRGSAPADGMPAEQRAEMAAAQRKSEEGMIVAEWARLGLSPMRRSDGSVISVSLAKTLRLLIEIKDRNGARLVTKEELARVQSEE